MHLFKQMKETGFENTRGNVRNHRDIKVATFEGII